MEKRRPQIQLAGRVLLPGMTGEAETDLPLSVRGIPLRADDDEGDDEEGSAGEGG